MRCWRDAAHAVGEQCADGPTRLDALVPVLGLRPVLPVDLAEIVEHRDCAGSGEVGIAQPVAGTISVLDYLGEIDWKDWPQGKDWYQRMKSRPSFRPLLADRVRGVTPASHYADLDF